jgi:3-methyladenine DNA glycosylase AlkC
MDSSDHIQRKGSRTLNNVPLDVIEQLNEGVLETANLMEALTVDFARLLQSALGYSLSEDRQQRLKSLGITQRMREASRYLLEQKFNIDSLLSHPSDTVRGWAGYMIAFDSRLSLKQKFNLIQNLADDHHFGVREWSWLSMRPYSVEDPALVIELLKPWLTQTANKRRFASEITRPRGVWCAHITILKEQPQMALSILDALKADPSRYVQNSVANWLNDSAKSQRQWVKDLCQVWQQESPTEATAYICKRALRNCK